MTDESLERPARRSICKMKRKQECNGQQLFLTDLWKALYFDRYTKLLAPAKAQVQDPILPLPELPDVKCCFCRPRNDGAFDFGCQSHHAFSGPKMPKYLAGARNWLEKWAEFCYTLEKPFLHDMFNYGFCAFVIWSRDLLAFDVAGLPCLVLRSNWGSRSIARWACCRGRVFIRPDVTHIFR